MAKYVEGTIDEYGKLIEPSLWEQEKLQHTPVLVRVYQKLTGEKMTPKLRKVRGYLPNNNPYEDLYRHGLHGIATGFDATCLYLWLIGHTTELLKDILEQLNNRRHQSQDKILGIWCLGLSRYFCNQNY